MDLHNILIPLYEADVKKLRGEEGGNEAREFARDVLEPMVLGG